MVAGSRRSRGSPRGLSAAAVAAAALCLAAALLPSIGAAPVRSASTDGVPGNVISIAQSPNTTRTSSFTITIKVANTTNITFVFFLFCQLTSPVCYSPVVMTAEPGNLFVGTTKPMTDYDGMGGGIKAGYNISVRYGSDLNITYPQATNSFSNLTVVSSVSGESMFAMTVEPQTFNLSGTVTDSATGNPIAGATVALTPGTATATTDAQGGYRFDAVVNGTYNLSITKAGYKIDTQEVKVAGEDVGAQNIALVNGTGTTRSTGTPGGNSTGGGTSWLSGPLVYVSVAVVALVALVGVGLLMLRRGRGKPPAGDASASAK